jgi:hypothetical protein
MTAKAAKKPKKKRKTHGGAKGGTFERAFSKKLSLWFTRGQREDVFWRSSNSGGRATVRSRKAKTTMGQYGDISATDPIGQPLIKALTFELKFGYNKETVNNLFANQSSQYYDWISTTITNRIDSGSHSWIIIHKRDFQDAIAWIPLELYEHLPFPFGLNKPILSVMFSTGITIVGIDLDDFLKHTPKQVITASELAANS